MNPSGMVKFCGFLSYFRVSSLCVHCLEEWVASQMFLNAANHCHGVRKLDSGQMTWPKVPLITLIPF